MRTIQDVFREALRRPKDGLIIDGGDALFFENQLKSRQNICISKGTNTGMTTAIRSIGPKSGQHIIVVESAEEINTPKQKW